MKKSGPDAAAEGLKRYLSPLSAWALSFGCAVGWGAFVMPGTTFLPVAGPLGTLIGLGVGAMIMFVVGRNYHYLIQNFPEAGGAYGYVKRVCGADHGYICGWFLILTYIAIAWANATALALIGRHLLGGLFSFGFKYEVCGYDVYLGEILLSTTALLLIGVVFLCGKRLAARLQTLFALVLCIGIAVCVAAVFLKRPGGVASLAPAFAEGKCAAFQIFAIVALAPWAFVGFETVSHSAEEFAFPRRRTVRIIVFSLVAATAAYIALAMVAASTCPPGFANWREYMAARGSFDGLEALPTFYAVKTTLGGVGLVLLCVTTLAAIVTGLIGHIVAASRLLYAMSRDGMLWNPLGRLDSDGSPRNAIAAIIAVSCLIPFLGRTAVGWLVDVTTIGASMAYGYVSFCAFRVAREKGRRWVMVSGCAGVAVSAAFIAYSFVPNFWVVDAMATESYFILAVWSIIGGFVFRRVFSRDKSGHVGTTTVAWIVLLFIIFFSGHMWNRQMTRNLTNSVVTEIGQRYAPVDKDGNITKEEAEAESFLQRQKEGVDESLTRYNLMQIGLVLIALAIMYSVYSVISRREKEAAKAKSYFFSTISHDFRTPLNAIVGFSQMLKLGYKTKQETDEAVESILLSSKSLLALVNDILDLSRRESGNAEFALVPTDCRELLLGVEEAFRLGAPRKGVEIRADIGWMPLLLVDPLRLRHVIVNLVSNAVKFTEKGFVEVRGRFEREANGQRGTLIVEVEDTGVGISEEDKGKIDSPYMQTASKMSRNGGTGLGLAVCRQLTKAMGGTMSFESELGKGSTFRITLPKVGIVKAARPGVGGHGPSELRIETPGQPPVILQNLTINFELSELKSKFPASGSNPSAPDSKPSAESPSTPRLLLVDDQKMNLAVLKALVKRIGGFETETAADGREALQRLQKADAPAFDAVLTDMWMPELDGEGLAKAIHADERLAYLPVHVITADVELQDNYAEKGFDSIILKPVTVDALSPILIGIAERKGVAA